MKSFRAISTQAKSPYLIAYISDRSGEFKIYLRDLEGHEITAPMPFQPGDVIPVGEPLPPGSGREPRIAFIRFEAQPGSTSASQIGTPGSVYIFTYGEDRATKVSGQVPRILAVAPAWSPDGKELAFAGVEDLNGDGQFTKDEAGIYVCNVERGRVRRVATVYVISSHLHWSPIEPALIFQAEKPNVPVPVAHLLDLTNGQLITRDDATTAACWSPDGQFIAFHSIADRKIHVLNKDGREQYAIDAPGQNVAELQWLPPRAGASADDTGTLLAIVSTQLRSNSGQLYLRTTLPSSTASWKAFTDVEAFAAYPAVSPDGRYLVYTLLSGHGPTSNADLYVLELGQAQPRRLTTEPGFDGFPSWIPAGK
ncbi:MAG: TolB family protein [Anaerolineae bacterium]